MNNKEIAQVLYDIADILEIQGEIPFKIVAYRNAARTIEFLAEDINDIYRRGGIEALTDDDLTQERPTGWSPPRDRAPIFPNINWMIQHDVYHAGQIAAMRGLYRGSNRGTPA